MSSEVMSNDDKILTTAATLCRDNLEQIRGKFSLWIKQLLLFSFYQIWHDQPPGFGRELGQPAAFISCRCCTTSHINIYINLLVVGWLYQMELGIFTAKWCFWRRTVTCGWRPCHEMFLWGSCRTLSDGLDWPLLPSSSYVGNCVSLIYYNCPWTTPLKMGRIDRVSDGRLIIELLLFR